VVGVGVVVGVGIGVGVGVRVQVDLDFDTHVGVLRVLAVLFVQHLPYMVIINPSVLQAPHSWG